MTIAVVIASFSNCEVALSRFCARALFVSVADRTRTSRAIAPRASRLLRFPTPCALNRLLRRLPATLHSNQLIAFFYLFHGTCLCYLYLIDSGIPDSWKKVNTAERNAEKQAHDASHSNNCYVTFSSRCTVPDLQRTTSNRYGILHRTISLERLDITKCGLSNNRNIHV